MKSPKPTSIRSTIAEGGPGRLPRGSMIPREEDSAKDDET